MKRHCYPVVGREYEAAFAAGDVYIGAVTRQQQITVGVSFSAVADKRGKLGVYSAYKLASLGFADIFEFHLVH